jgi:hypothetical protein
MITNGNLIGVSQRKENLDRNYTGTLPLIDKGHGLTK